MADICLVCEPSFGSDMALIVQKIQEAIEKGHADCAEVLLHIQNSLSSWPGSLDEALVEATQKGQFGLVKYLFRLEHSLFLGDLQQPLCEAMSRGYMHIMEFLIASALDVEGQTPLILATIKGDENMVKSVLQAGADVNRINQLTGQTALMEAASKGCTKIATLLIEAGADVNQVDKFGKTALMVAVQKGCLNVTEALAEAGADVNLVSKSGDTALMVAARNEHLNITKVLIDAGADVNKICAWEETVLAHFALKGNVQGVRLLLRSGAKVNIGRLPFEALKRNIRLLLEVAGQEELYYPEILECPTDTLHHHCRMAIRRHLLKLDRHENLFVRIPRLGLPSRLTKYLLFDTSLDENDT